MQYRRVYQKGGWYFFTLVTHNRQPVFNNHETVGLLRQAFKRVKRSHPFELNAAVILPDHIHCIWFLPHRDQDFSTRWRLIKSWFSKHYRQQLPVWQQRFWEHVIRDEQDYRHHLDYLHFNPVKHGYVMGPSEWPYSSFGKFVRQGFYSQDWGGQVEVPEDVGNE